MDHLFFEKHDINAPNFIKDRNGDIALCMCKICGCVEASLPTDCPGVRVISDVQDKIQKGELDFIKGEWRHTECFEIKEDI